MTSGAVIGLIPRLVMPWQRTATEAALDANHESVNAVQVTSSRLDAVVGDELIVRAIEGDEAARRQVFDAHVDRVFRLAFRMTGDAYFAEDITQDVFVRVFDRLSQFRGDAPFGAWLHRVATTTILNALRKSRARSLRETSLDEARYAATRTGGIEPDMRDRVRAALASLPEGLRLVVIMFDVEGYSHDEIAEVLGITSGASRVRLSRARDSLRAVLAMDAEEWSS
jgi:RNA polymerase sigma-70 factor, ECF subfamily